MKKLFSLIIIGVLGILAYNQFYGSDEDKARGQEVIKEFKDLGKSVIGLFKAEKANLDSGKYNDALDKIGNLFKGIGQKVESLGEDFPDRLKELKTKKDQLESNFKERKNTGESVSDTEQKELEELYQDLDNLLTDMDKK